MFNNNNQNMILNKNNNNYIKNQTKTNLLNNNTKNDQKIDFTITKLKNLITKIDKKFKFFTN